MAAVGSFPLSAYEQVAKPQAAAVVRDFEIVPKKKKQIGVSLELWKQNPDWHKQLETESYYQWEDRFYSRKPPKGTTALNINGILTTYGLKSRKSKKSPYRSYKKKYSICKMEPKLLTSVQIKKRRSICKGTAYKKAQRKFSLCKMDPNILTLVQRKKRRSLCK